MTIAWIALSARFTPGREGGEYFTTNPSLGYLFWSRYLNMHQEVRLIVRIFDGGVDSFRDGAVQVTGPGVTVTPVKDFRLIPRRPRQIAHTVNSMVRSVRQRRGSIYLRLPCPLSSWIWMLLEIRHVGYAVQLVGDPGDALLNLKSPLLMRRVLANVGRLVTRAQVKRAHTVSYVTRHYLQERYPAGRTSTTHTVPSVSLPPEAFRSPSSESRNSATLIFIGSLEREYKGVEYLLQAFVRLIPYVDAQLWIVGGGKLMRQYQECAQQLGVAKRVQFFGHVPSRQSLLALLDSASLFVLPSLAEGLPKALLEAMARGLPCVGTSVGGIPELLEIPVLVPPRDSVALASTLKLLLTDDDLQREHAWANFRRAALYREEEVIAATISFCGSAQEADRHAI